MANTEAGEGAQPGLTSLGANSAPAPISPSTPSVAYAPTSNLRLDQFLTEVLKNEGGFADDPSDSGGATNYGISLNFAKGHPAFFASNLAAGVTVADIKAMTAAKAAVAYRTFFWTPARLNLLPDASNIALQMLDMAVNMGVNISNGESEAVRVLQRAICTTVDGELGPHTLAWLNLTIAAHGARAINNSIVNERIATYEKIVAVHPQDAAFLQGWENRANKYRV